MTKVETSSTEEVVKKDIFGFSVYCPIWFFRIVKELAEAKYNRKYFPVLNEWRLKAEAYDMLRSTIQAQPEEVPVQAEPQDEGETVRTFTGVVDMTKGKVIEDEA